ncbi:MAG: 16S rRNA (uracil(1498)-N(3))-methyltransferase, partial [Pseudomonadota bacterium]
MPSYDFSGQRLFVQDDLGPDVTIRLDAAQTNYAVNVLRLKVSDTLLLFNGRDGEWQGEIIAATRKACDVRLVAATRAQTPGPDIDYVFAPLKRARLDYMVQRVTEMGVARLVPVLTDRTQAERVKLERMRANCIEAAEQCGVLRVPDVVPPVRFAEWHAAARQDSGRAVIFCDESADVRDPIAALAAVAPGPIAVVIGPEGGFSAAERTALIGLGHATQIALGPRIMRADTAAVAALALVNAVIGDWRQQAV